MIVKIGKGLLLMSSYGLIGKVNARIWNEGMIVMPLCDLRLLQCTVQESLTTLAATAAALLNLARLSGGS
jgi:hypothetical protein